MSSFSIFGFRNNRVDYNTQGNYDQKTTFAVEFGNLTIASDNALLLLCSTGERYEARTDICLYSPFHSKESFLCEAGVSLRHAFSLTSTSIPFLLLRRRKRESGFCESKFYPQNHHLWHGMSLTSDPTPIEND